MTNGIYLNELKNRSHPYRMQIEGGRMHFLPSDASLRDAVLSLDGIAPRKKPNTAFSRIGRPEGADYFNPTQRVGDKA